MIANSVKQESFSPAQQILERRITEFTRVKISQNVLFTECSSKITVKLQTAAGH
jgi:hypothetical protein